MSAAGSERIELEPLAGPDLRAFINETLEGCELNDEMRFAVARAGEGNPFFTEELLKSAVEGRTPAGSSNASALPRSVRATLLERLRPLDDHERRVLAQAAVIGRSFDLALLAQTLQTDTQSLLPALLRARNFQLISEVSPTLFQFRHALTREAIYGNFLAAQLRPLHHTIALALESAPADQRSVESLAYHWWAAGDRSRSAHYNEMAGDNAAAIHAHEDAIAYFQRALKTVDALCGARGRLLEKVADRRVAASFHDMARSAYAQAAAVFHELGDSEREATCLVREALESFRCNDSKPTAGLQAMLERLDKSDYLTRSRIHLGIARITVSLYQVAETIHHLAQIDRRAIDLEPEIKFRFHNVQEWLAMVMGDAQRFRVEHEKSVEGARNIGLPQLLASVLANGAGCYALFGLHDDAQHDIRLAFHSAREERSREGEALAHAKSARCCLLRGDVVAAKAAVEAVRALPVDNQMIITEAAAWGPLPLAISAMRS